MVEVAISAFSHLPSGAGVLDWCCAPICGKLWKSGKAVSVLEELSGAKEAATLRLPEIGAGVLGKEDLGATGVFGEE